MTIEEAKQNGYTHHAVMYGIRGYVKFEDDYGMEFSATNKLMDLVHESIVYLDALIGFHKEGFLIKVTQEL